MSVNALKAIDSAYIIYFSAITVIEITYLTEKEKIPQLALKRLLIALNEPSGNWKIIPIDLDIALSLSEIDRQIVPEMPDRIITATALYLNLPLVTRDTKITASIVNTIW
ncbi:type II toxin-antitoxin system VapC family toxin [Geminocystis herdmanii]|uniref:type II toxin-antitoxin system VapC family toxin n=1 Tax=Geminocystis herdmanii TaxID=669359 RepID=UPI001ED9C521|nr:PIN domain-containing protein [Geminocystis herdmanii]